MNCNRCYSEGSVWAVLELEFLRRLVFSFMIFWVGAVSHLWSLANQQVGSSPIFMQLNVSNTVLKTLAKTTKVSARNTLVAKFRYPFLFSTSFLPHVTLKMTHSSLALPLAILHSSPSLLSSPPSSLTSSLCLEISTSYLEGGSMLFG